jgi:hypothetical protein
MEEQIPRRLRGWNYASIQPRVAQLEFQDPLPNECIAQLVTQSLMGCGSQSASCVQIESCKSALCVSDAGYPSESCLSLVSHKLKPVLRVRMSSNTHLAATCLLLYNYAGYLSKL